MDKLYTGVKNFVVISFLKVGRKHEIKHFKRTVYWLKKLKPDADEAMCIAAIAHDIERAFRRKDMAKKRQKGPAALEYYRPHEERGAEIMRKILKKMGADDKTAKRVKILISRHEEGGSLDQNLLKDADSISFFENNVGHFIADGATKIDKQKVKEKIDWMFDRITFNKAKKIALPMYKKAIKQLNKCSQ